MYNMPAKVIKKTVEIKKNEKKSSKMIVIRKLCVPLSR
jgi:hypothetical protein